MKHSFHRRALGVSTLILAAAVAYAAQPVTEIVLPGKGIFPESITSTSDGTLIVGSLGHGNVSRIAPGKTAAEEWIKPGTGGLNGVLGVFADEKGKNLWVCSNNLENKGEIVSSDAQFPFGAECPQGTLALGGGVTISINPATQLDEFAKVTVIASRPRGNPPRAWYGAARINTEFIQVDPHPEVILETYVICTT